MRQLLPVASRYLVAVGASVAVGALRFLLSDVLGDVARFLPFILAVMVAAWYGGLGPGLLATALGAGISMLLLVPAGDPAWSVTLSEAVGLGIFLATSLTVVALCERLHRSHRRLEAEQARMTGSREFHAAIAELSADFGYEVRLPEDGPVVLEAVTDGFTKVLGYELEELNAQGGWSRLIHPDDLPAFQRTDARPATAGRAEGETRMLAKDGRLVWVHYTNRAVADERGKVVLLIGAARDITARKTAEDALRSSEERYRSLVAATTAIVWTADPSGAFVEPQPSWQLYTGQAWAQHRGWGWTLALHPEDRERVKALWQDAVARRTPYESAGRLWHAASRGYRYYEARAVPLFEGDGRVKEWIGTCADVDDRQRAEESLRESDRRKDEFLAILAHELRNPLAPLRNALAILEEAGDDVRAMARVRPMMERQLAQLVRRVDDLLDVSRITRERLELRRERVELGSILAQAVETVRTLVDGARHELVITTPPRTLLLHADPARLAQVLANLLHNACKFTPPGGRIWLRVERRGDEVTLAVKDTGVGISPEMLPRVFELFTQADRSLEREQGGLGIGLTLVKRLVEMHGGSIAVHSDGLGKGSEFVVCLPLLGERERPEPARRPEPQCRSGAARRVLVADDNRDVAESLAEFLRLRGSETLIVHDGAAAVGAAETFRPDVVLLDIGLPVLNGFDVARRIRSLPAGKELLLVAVTGWGQPDDRRRSEEAGFDLHLVKPVDPMRLGELLATAWAARGSARA